MLEAAAIKSSVCREGFRITVDDESGNGIMTLSAVFW